jgi:hypothetical protein
MKIKPSHENQCRVTIHRKGKPEIIRGQKAEGRRQKAEGRRQKAEGFYECLPHGVRDYPGSLGMKPINKSSIGWLLIGRGYNPATIGT